VKLRSRVAALAAASTITLGAGALAGGGLLPESDSAQAFVPAEVKRLLAGPKFVFPLRAKPQYGDGLGAGRGHEGQDMFAPAGTPEVAVADAVVIETGSDGGRGNYVSIYSRDTNRTYNYFHMLSPAFVRHGERVKAGQKLGELGCTGSCWGDHLHFEARIGRSPYGQVIDPLPFLKRISPA
jgi:murein DD-endopeptidase MepM/ murein hydrolase activator NlpD